VILDEIVEHKRLEVAEAKARLPLAELRSRVGDVPPPRDFRGACAGGDTVALIAEIKRASPSAGLIREDFDPAAIATLYQEAGAAALSVLTDRKYFEGDLAFVAEAKAAAPLPTLRKDFITDAYQIYEARAADADAVLLIVRILSDEQFGDYLALAHGLGMAALVETHCAEEVARAVAGGALLIGINNRDLDTLAVDLAVTEKLAAGVPGHCIVVAESGVRSRDDVRRLAACGVHAILVGQSLMQSDDVAAAARELVGVPRAVGPSRALPDKG